MVEQGVTTPNDPPSATSGDAQVVSFDGGESGGGGGSGSTNYNALFAGTF